MERSVSDLSFADIATGYARDVVEGRIPACEWHHLACKRHLDDLARATIGAWPYAWNPELTDRNGKSYLPADRICTFAELMPHIKGEWAGRDNPRIKLEPVQVFILSSIFGWIHRDTGKRRFRFADIFVPRKNGKSTLAAVIGLYMLALDDEYGAEVYSGATTQGQAYEVFRPALLMTRASDRFRERFGVTPNASNISVRATNSKFEPVIGNPGDGASPSCSLVDEYHEHKTSDLYDTMRTGMGARSQPLLVVITTAGTNIAGPCYQHQQGLQQILQGLIQDDRRFGIIFGIDNEDDWHTEAALRMANPLLGISVNEESLRADQAEAIRDPRKQSIFKTKHLNVWVGAASPWLNLHKAKACGDPTLTLDAFRGEPCIVGLDLASKTDIASAVFEFERDIDGLKHYYAISRNYIPEAAAKLPENEHYRNWIATGHLIVTPGNMIDLERIQEDIITAAETVVIAGVAKDPWGGQQMGPNLEAEGLQVVDVPQKTLYLSEPMKDLQGLVDSDPPRFHHDGNPCYLWQLGNVEVKPDRNENIFPRKARPQNKIDAAIGTIVAHNRHMAGAVSASSGRSAYEEGITI